MSPNPAMNATSAWLQHGLEMAAHRFPQKEAVAHKTRRISYRELDAISTQLARALQTLGVQIGDRVGLYLDKSLEAVVAVFGVLKAGAAYVPLDPFAPARRVARIIDDCRMKALVTHVKKLEGLSREFAEASPIEAMLLIGDAGPKPEGTLPAKAQIAWAELGRFPTRPLALPALTDEHLAYIFYTSGSTGSPKGVMISHRAALSFVDWAFRQFDVRPTDRVSNHAPLHFDLSVFDLFTALKAGATLILVPPELSVFPISLARFIRDERITIWYSVPSALIQLVLRGQLHERPFPDLREVLFAGEVLPVKYLRSLMQFIPQARFWNLYGPTETNVCTCYPVQASDADRLEPLPIGQACAGAEVFVLNDQNELAQPGETGELFVKGRSLMTGYWGRPELTQEVLVRNPLRLVPDAGTAYRTGDLVKPTPNGNLLYVGRRDDRVKSRGYRIELREIEDLLAHHPEVEEAAIVAFPDEEIGHEIRAFVVPRAGCVPTAQALAAHCAEHLPKYMIPGSIELRSFLPRTTTGKLKKSELWPTSLKASSEIHERRILCD